MTGHHRVVVVGAGFGGIGASIKLAEADIDHLVLEKADDVGGTWLANQYPGCRCDVASNLYSFSFALNPDWPETYSTQPEIWRYLRQVAEDYRVIERIRFGCAVVGLSWEDGPQHWRIQTSQGTLTADVVIAAHGFLSEPSVPQLPGMERFQGRLMHSAQWDTSCDLTGLRVAVVGTGASAVQIVPRVHEVAKRLYVFQRTPGWVLPHRGRPTKAWERTLYRKLPAVQRALRALTYLRSELLLLPRLVKNPARLGIVQRMALEHLEQQVPDPQLRAKLIPSYLPGCKRLLPSNDYLPAIASPKTELVTDAIQDIDSDGIITADGVKRAVDAIVLATGFRVTDNTFAALVRGRDGRSLREVWDAAGGMRGHNGTTFAGFPNLFMLAGPNTGIGHTSLVYMIEAQLRYIGQALRLMGQHGIASLEVRPDVETAYTEEMQRRLRTSVWTTGGCTSWYLDRNGNNTTIWPDFTFNYARRLRRFDLESYYQRMRPVLPPDQVGPPMERLTALGAPATTLAETGAGTAPANGAVS